MTDSQLRDGTKGQTYILFGVSGTTYAVPSQQVQHMEIVEQVTPVPNAAPFVEGVVFSRGHVVPVLSMRARFGFERTTMSPRARLLVVQHGPRRVGLLADEAREFTSIPDSSIRPPQESIGDSSGPYVEGVATIGERIVLILNIGELLESSRVDVPSAARA